MEKYLKFDGHVHSKGISLCSLVDYKQLVDDKKKQGYDGIILTNHCKSEYYPPQKQNEYIKKLVDEFNKCYEYAKGKGLKVIFGIEITTQKPFFDWLLYGITEEILLKMPCLYELNQEELFNLCNEYGVVLVRAHPLRKQTSYVATQGFGDTSLMHGIEINCSPSDVSGDEVLNVDTILAEVNKKGLVVSCGTDYHADNNKFLGGMLLPDYVETSQDFGEYLRKTDQIILFFKDSVLEIPILSNKKIKEKIDETY